MPLRFWVNIYYYPKYEFVDLRCELPKPRRQIVILHVFKEDVCHITAKTKLPENNFQLTDGHCEFNVARVY